MSHFTALKKIFRIPVFLMTLVMFVFMAQPAQAQTTAAWSGNCVEQETIRFTNNSGETPQSGSETVNVATIQGLQCLIANVLSVIISAIGLTGFVMMIVASFMYLLSGGNSKGIENSRNTITYAVVGLVVALSSVIILNIIAAFTGISLITNFRIPGSDCGLPGQPSCQAEEFINQ